MNDRLGDAALTLPPNHLPIAIYPAPRLIVAVLTNRPQERLRIVDFEDPFNDATPLEPVAHYSFVDLMQGMAAVLPKHPRHGLKRQTRPTPKDLRGLWFL